MSWEEWTVDSNLTAIHQSPKSVARGKTCCFHCWYCQAHKYASRKVISFNTKMKWMDTFMTDISISKVKIGLFVFWQIANGCIFPSPLFSHYSCAAGYDVCARRAWMEDISYKWGKEGNLIVPSVSLFSMACSKWMDSAASVIILIFTGQRAAGV